MRPAIQSLLRCCLGLLALLVVAALGAPSAQAATPVVPTPGVSDSGSCSDAGPREELVFVRCGGQQVVAFADPHGRIARSDLCSRIFEELLLALGEGVFRGDDRPDGTGTAAPVGPPTAGVLPELAVEVTVWSAVGWTPAAAALEPRHAWPPPEPPPRA